MTDEQLPIEENNEEVIPEIVQDETKEKTGFFNRKCKNCQENEDKTEEYKKDWQRALADYKNLQKEISERRGEWAQMSKGMILEDFIPVYDNFKSAFFHNPV
ncbi:MAG: nucleotide exchange factor GrpE, partial [Candidatus Magasanikbacteria bacterium RIFOXYD2_FULL_36_9]